MHEIKIPQLGQSVEEASIVTWHKKEGDAVKQGEPLFSVQTDKAEIECESTASGTLRKILVQPDVFVPVLAVVALVGDPSESLPDLGRYSTGQPTQPAASNVVAVESSKPAASAPVNTVSQPQSTAVSPRAKNKAKELHVPPSVVHGTGIGGRVMEEDVAAYAQSTSDIRVTPVARRTAELQGVDVARVQGTGPRGKITKDDVLAAGTSTPAVSSAPGSVKRIPLTPMRRIIATRMAESKFSAPHYYMTIEVDMAAAVRFRAACQGFTPSYNDIVLFATTKAIQQHPNVNARWAGDAIEVVADINLGMAVALPSGLIVPVLRNTQQLSLQSLSQQCKTLVEKAKSGKLLPDDYSGNTFTVSNLGALGVDHFTAIINQPDSAILAVGQMKERPVVIDGGIHIRPIMKLTLSSDHRVIDGAVAAQFMGALKTVLEAAQF
jgi:pyruvate dehydrogenase E2 component (dihydrolipoamide acetyltransferase)